MKNNKKYRLIIVLILLTLLQVCLFNTIISLAQETSTSQVIEDGTYFIKSIIDENYVLDIEGASSSNLANVELFEYNGQENQQFKIKHVGNGYYQIIAVHSNKVLDVEACKKENETNVEQFSENIPLTSNQKWKIQKNTDGTYSFISECNGLYLDIYQAKAQNKVNIQVYEGHNGIGQKFKFEKVNNTTIPETNTGTGQDIDQGTSQGGSEGQENQIVENGVYSIVSAISDNFVLDVKGGSKADCANIQIYEKQAVNREKFKLEYLKDGTYKITSVNSNKVLDVQNDGRVNETNVCQFTPRNPISDNEKWIIKNAGGGYYYIISKASGLYLDIYNAEAKNGANVQIYEGHEGIGQKFKFIQPLDLLGSIDTNKYPGYKEKIKALMDAHPAWNFELLYTGLKFDDVITGETSLHSRNLVPKNYGGEWICQVCGTKLYDSGWYCASR